ncbi:hypothetical protein [Streptomyces sp. LN549]|uniref:hypothetical protein n=1 Tax=Streptomyces sp. LN549 TaxID=3112979 RepID=UPI0037125204
MVKSFARIAVAGAAVATVLGGTMSTAQATEVGALDTDKSISSSHGKMIYHDDGDVFEICDTNADGYGVVGALYISKTAPHLVFAIDDGGDAGCDKGGYDVTNSSDYQMALMWNGGGATITSAWFNE